MAAASGPKWKGVSAWSACRSASPTWAARFASIRRLSEALCSRSRSPSRKPRAMSTIRILLADDHVVMRRGIRALLERREDFKVVAEAGDGREAVQLTEVHSPDVVVIDIAMPNLNGIEAARQIASKAPRTAIVILSM